MKKSGSNLNSPHRQSSPVSPESKAKGKGKGKGKVKEGKAKGKGKEDALSPRTPATGTTQTFNQTYKNKFNKI